MTNITFAQLYNLLLNFTGNTIIHIHAITPHNGFFKAGMNGSRKAADKMINILGIDPKNIVKEQWKNLLLTNCPFDKLVENAMLKQTMLNIAKWDDMSTIEQDNFLNELNIALTVDGAQITREEASELVGEYELSERKNGTNITNCLVESKKDNMGMFNTMDSVASTPNYRYINTETNEVLDITSPELKPFINADYALPSAKQIDFGIAPENCVRPLNFRFDRVIDFKMNKVHYRVVPE